MKSICLAVTCLVITSVAAADTITVCSSGCDHTSINDAIDAASTGDVIQLSAQTYYEGEEINTDGKAITLSGAVDKSGAALSILDGGNSHRVLYCQGGEDADTVFENLVIRNGFADNGGGMRNGGSRPTLTNCTFTDNVAQQYGGGVQGIGCWSIMTNCTFTGNVAQSGGGLYSSSGHPTLTNCTFTGNEAQSGDGGGVLLSSSSPTLENCTFTGNSANHYGGGMWNISSSSPIIITCRFEGNSATINGGALYSGFQCNPSLTDTTVCGNTTDQIDGDWTDNGGNTVAEECPSDAGTITVCSSGCDYISINDAIDAANTGDVIQLSAQTYYEGEEISTDGKAITLSGAVDKSGAATSILDGGNSHRVLHCYSDEGAGTVFENLVIQNGSAGSGGGMYNYNQSNPTLDNCTFTGNSAENYGGGMYNVSSNPTLANCTFTGNETTYGGGGMFNYSGNPTLENCTFTENSANYGGGMDNFANSNPALDNCTFTGNSVNYSGGGMHNDFNCNPTLTNCMVCGNTPDQIVGDTWIDNGGNTVEDECLEDCPADFNDDGEVSGADLGLMIAFWGTSGGDLTGDKTTDGADLGLLIAAWGPCLP